MIENKLIFLKDSFPEFELQFSDDFTEAVILNPNYNENITVYDEGFEFTVYFSFQHRHLEDKEDVVEWVNEIITGNKFAIEFFNNEQRRFGSEIDAEEMQDLSYEKLEHFTGYYGLTKLFDMVDSFKVRGWDSKNNFDFTFFCETNGNISINKTFVGVL